MTEREKALELVAAMLPAEIVALMKSSASPTGFGSELGELALKNVFTELWLRPGLDRRSRSLLTLGILIALRASDELAIHFIIAANNGLSVSELEEVIYHSTGYAGFPAASSARTTAIEALRKAGLVE